MPCIYCWHCRRERGCWRKIIEFDCAFAQNCKPRAVGGECIVLSCTENRRRVLDQPQLACLCVEDSNHLVHNICFVDWIHDADAMRDLQRTVSEAAPILRQLE